jgi:hypothetical protein
MNIDGETVYRGVVLLVLFYLLCWKLGEKWERAKNDRPLQCRQQSSEKPQAQSHSKAWDEYWERWEEKTGLDHVPHSLTSTDVERINGAFPKELEAE